MKAQVDIYQEGTTENHIWVVFKKTSGGDAFLLRKLFETVLVYQMIKEVLFEDQTQK